MSFAAWKVQGRTNPDVDDMPTPRVARVESGEGSLINKFKYISILIGLWLVLSTQASGAINPPHQFRKDQCGLCHGSADGKMEPTNLLPVSSEICVTCHAGMTGSLSHPVDITPDNPPPSGMPLVDGRLSCLTCHFVHPASLQADTFRRSLLRKTGMGAQFCMTCHRKGANDHALFEKAHPASRSNTGRQFALDAYTLQCAQCHDRHLRPWQVVVRSGGRRRSANGPGQHPVGAALADVAAKNPKRFNAPAFLSEQMRLYDGRIGCGTCHSAYSKEKNMLVTDNRAGGLCLQCHIK